MKTLNFDILEVYQLTNEEMISVRGGGESDGDPTPTVPVIPIKN
jgi:hypothetical protein